MTSRLSTTGSNLPVSQNAAALWTLRLLVNARGWSVMDINNFTRRLCSEDSDPVLTKALSALREAMVAAEENYMEKTMNSRRQELPAEMEPLLEIFRKKGVTKLPRIIGAPKLLTDALSKVEKAATKGGLFSPMLAENLALVGELFALNETEKLFYAFQLFLKNDERLRNAANLFDYKKGGVPLYTDVFVCATGANPSEAQALWSRQSPLMRSGLISITDNDRDDAEDWFELSNVSANANILTEPVSREDILASRFAAADAAELALTDFEHIPEVAGLVIPYLKAAAADHKKGVNILLYGPAGTGKTQLSRVIARELGMTAYEIAVKKSVREDFVRSKPTENRLAHWETACRCLGSNPEALLVFDEAEDVFWDNVIRTDEGMRRTNKAEINRLLETNACPTLWLTNSISCIDPAMVRRFDMAVKVPQPSAKQRRRIIDKVTEGALSEKVCEQLAQTANLAPGVLTRSLEVIKTLKFSSAAERDKSALQVIEGVLKAQRLGTVRHASGISDVNYSLDFINCDTDPQALADGIRRTGAARLCLYGLPGTGKSAYVQWLAKELDKPLMVRRASDLLSCWVGATEQNIARAFEEARKDDAVLLIDEADSFLQDRRGAGHSWEVTQVNEVLTQMENFEGVFIATTNLIKTLDQAALRRFDMKLLFKPLTARQSRELFLRHAATLGIADTVTEETLTKVGALDNVTPGDFAAVARQSKFAAAATAEDFYARLKADCELKAEKEGRGHKIGF